jgi:hypothetical protein
MKIYEPSSSETNELCHPLNPDEFEKIDVLINGTPRLVDWKPISMEIIREDGGRKFLESDSPWLGGHALIFRPRAVAALGSLLRAHGELLQLLCGGADVVLYNPTRLLDALDEAASSVRRFTTGRIMWIDRYVFRPAVIEGIDIFKIPNLRVSPTFVSQRFVDLWTTAGLKGLEFKQVWAQN